MSLRSRAIRALSSIVYNSHLLRPVTTVVGHARRAAAFPILTFHRVNDDEDPFFPALSTAVFAARMRHIARHYVVLTVEELVSRMERGQVPRNAIALTFDDGYRDNLTRAAPILARHGLPATIFLATGYIGTPELLWFDRLALAFKTTTREELCLTDDRTVPLDSAAARLRALSVTLDQLKRLPELERQRSLERLLALLRPGGLDRPKRFMLTWDEVDALRGLGFSIGAHSVTHAILSRLTSEHAWREIHGSKRAIEEALGVPVRAFAYPNGGAGDYNETVTRLVREAGFGCAVTTRHGLNSSATPCLELRRGGPSDQHLPTYALKLAYYRLAAG